MTTPMRTDRVHTQESLTEHLHRQALALRLSDVDRAALRFLIESLTEDGYLEDPIETLAAGAGGQGDPEQLDELVHHFTVALRLLQSLEPTAWARATWPNA
jgi:RNA polymerase sigma-54 factor